MDGSAKAAPSNIQGRLFRCHFLCVVGVAFLLSANHALAQAPAWPSAQMREFLRSAEVSAAEQTRRRQTRCWRCELSDARCVQGVKRHDHADWSCLVA